MITLVLQSAYEDFDGTAPSLPVILGIARIRMTKTVPFALFKLNKTVDRKAMKEIRDQLECCRFHIGSGRELALAAKEHPDIFPAPTVMALGKRYEPILYRYTLSGDAEVAPEILQEGELFFVTKS